MIAPLDQAWHRLDDELALWTALGKTATLWWRDDDASTMTPALAQMLALSADFSVPLGLAVVPARIDPSLVAALKEAPLTTALQHGYCHTNHAPADQKKAEFGAHRPLSDMIGDAGAGWAHLAGCPRVAPIFVPPWNRWTATLAPGLAAIGLEAVSTYGSRTLASSATGLLTVNTHIDLIDWRGSRGFAGTQACVTLLIRHLSARRLGTVDPHEHTGLLTHHLDHDDTCWAFLRDFFAFVSWHNGLVWVSPADLLTSSASSLA
jgi:hypothetical protein